MLMFLWSMKHLKAFNILSISLLLAFSICVVSTQAFSFENVKFIKEINTTLKQPVDVTVSPSGDIYILDEEASKVFIFDSDDNLKLNFGERGSKPEQLSNPKSIVISPDEEIIVADTGNSRIQVLAVTGIDKEVMASRQDYPPAIEFDSFMPAEKSIVDMHFIPGKGLFYLPDKKNHIVFFDDSTQQTFEKEGEKPGEFDKPIFNSDGIFLNTFGEPYREGEKANKKGSFRYPKSIVINSQNEVFVLDHGNNRIQVFDEQGIYLGEVGGKGSEEGQFDNVTDIAIDENDYLYVADSGNHSIQIFDQQGKFIMLFGSLDKRSDLFQGLFKSKEDNSKTAVTMNPGYFQEISAITVSEGKVFVADYKTDQLQVFSFHPNGFYFVKSYFCVFLWQKICNAQQGGSPI